MKIICGDCSQERELPADFFGVGGYLFWRQHGHFPGLVTFSCVCGAQHVSGPEARPDVTDPWLSARDAVAADKEFYRRHLACAGSNGNQPRTH